MGRVQVIVLDTHVWVWWVDDHPRLNPGVREQIDRASVKIVSAISFFEITIAASINRLTLSPTPESWFTIAESADGLRVEPLTSQTCLAARRLPGEFHRDPGDKSSSHSPANWTPHW